MDNCSTDKDESNYVPIIIDTRSRIEYISSHVDGAINIPPEKFMAGGIPSELNDVSKDEQIILYCLSGSRSNVVMHIMSSMGFTNLQNGINKDRVERALQLNS